MKKTTLKISFFLLLSMFALQGYAQFVSIIVEDTKYNIKNVATGDYLKGIDFGNSAYEFTNVNPTGADATYNFFFNHHDTVDPDTGTVHNYPDDWNIGSDARGIMRAANPGTVNTTFKYNVWNSNGGHKTDKRWVETLVEQSGVPTFRFSPLVADRYLYQGLDGVLYNYSEATMDDAAETNTDGQARSYWVLEEAAVLSNEKFDVSSIFVANPVKDMLSINGLTSNVKSVSLYSLIGKEIMSKELSGESSISLNISSLASGMYIVDFKGENGNFTKKIIKQ